MSLNQQLNRREVVDLAFHQAVLNGWSILDKYEAREFLYVEPQYLHGPGYTQVLLSDHFPANPFEQIPVLAAFSLADLFYDKEFAFALWGSLWAQHMQQMVVSPDPIEYLRTTV